MIKFYFSLKSYLYNPISLQKKTSKNQYIFPPSLISASKKMESQLECNVEIFYNFKIKYQNRNVCSSMY